MPSDSPRPGPRTWLRVDPLLALYLGFILSLPLARSPVSVSGIPVQLSDAVLVLLFAGFAVRALAGRTILRPDTLLVASAVLVAVLGLTAVRAGPTVANLVKLAGFSAYVFLPSLSRRLLVTEEHLASALRAWLAAAALTAIVGLAGFVAFYADRSGVGAWMMCGWGGVPSLPTPRLCAPFANSNMLCSYLTIAVGLAAGCVLRLWPPVPAWALLAGLTSTAAFTLSASIGGFAIAGAAALLGFGRAAGWRREWIRVGLAGATVVSVLLATGASLATLQPRGLGHFALFGRDVLVLDSPRLSVWRGTVPSITGHPLLGLGYGALVSRVSDPRANTSPDALPSYHPASLPPLDPPALMDAHNVWLNVAGQAGVLGLAAFIWVLLALALPLRQVRFRRGSGLEALPNALLAAFAGAVLFGGLFAAIEEARHVWALFGLMAATRGWACVRQIPPRGNPG